MKKKNKFLILLFMFSLSILFTGCTFRSEILNYRPIEDINELDGRRIGTPLSWPSDYYLTPRNDILLYRYDTAADALMALKYKRVDAVAIDICSAKEIINCVGGLEIFKDPITAVDIVAVFSPYDEELKNEFNDFLNYYRETDEYKRMLERMLDPNYVYQFNDIPQTGTGKTINFIVTDTYYPITYYDIPTKTVMGYDIEIFRAFANYKNYKLELISGSYDDVVHKITTGEANILTNGLSSYEKKDYESAGLKVSDMMYPMDIVFINLSKDGKVEQLKTVDW